MIKLAIGYSTKDSAELTKQTFPRILVDAGRADIFWCDASKDPEAINFVANHAEYAAYYDVDVFGGADAAIAWKLSKMLASSKQYTHIGLLENDVLLDEDWFEPTMELFEKGAADGLEVGAVSPRSYVDRVLIQRDGYAVCHNLGAGVVIFTREAAQLILRTFRTGFWLDNVNLFAQASGIDLRTYAAFRGNAQPVTTDWTWDAQLAAHGLASLALTPAKVQMIGQNPPLAEQGLELVSAPAETGMREIIAFARYRDQLDMVRKGARYLPYPYLVNTEGDGQLFFPHQLGHLGAQWQGTLELQNCQGLGPFAYRAGPGGASLSVPIFGSCGVLVSGGRVGAQVTIQDLRSGFRFSPPLPAGDSPGTIPVPGGAVPRTIQIDLAEGAVLHGISTDKRQALDLSFSFQWDQLPPAGEVK